MISKRTKTAFAETTRQGTELGIPRIHEAIRATAAHREQGPVPEVVKLINECCGQGRTLRAITQKLNPLNIRPRSWAAPVCK
jgi:hypothetical protein